VKYTLRDQPRQVRLDTMNYCNARCIPCHLNWQTREKGRMKWKMLQAVLEDIATWPRPLEELVAVQFGELFCRKDWYDILRQVEERLPQTAIALPTNGAFLDDEVVKELASIRTLKWLNFSINAFFRETYEAFTGLKVDTVDRIKRAAELLRVLRPDLVTCASLVFDTTYQTEMERDLFVEFWRPLVSVVSINPAAYAGSLLKKPAIPVKTACRSIFDGLVVLYDGKVVTGCCWDSSGELEIGSFPEQSLLEIWRGKALKGLCSLHNVGRREEIKLCASCTFA